jgi:hypothetical protein
MTAFENRRSPRENILVEINIAQSSLGYCAGYAENVSKEAIAVTLTEGQLLPTHKVALLGLKIWNGEKSITRQLSAHVKRIDDKHVVFTFAGDDAETQAVIEELIKYQSKENTGDTRKRLVTDQNIVYAAETETE